MTETTIKSGCAVTNLIDGDASGGDANGEDASGGDANDDPSGGLTDSPLFFMSVFAPLVMAVMFAAL